MPILILHSFDLHDMKWKRIRDKYYEKEEENDDDEEKTQMNLNQ